MAIIIKERFEVDPEALLGEGAFGAVVRAVDRANGDRAVACKIINTAQFTREAIDLECSVLEAVRGHPNIVDLLDYHHDDARAVSYVFMELVPGSELFERVTTNTDPQGRLTESQARPLFLELVRAVKHCHCKGVAHRDLKVCAARYDACPVHTRLHRGSECSRLPPPPAPWLARRAARQCARHAGRGAQAARLWPCGKDGHEEDVP